MIQINQLYITPDSKNLVIDAKIVDNEIYSKVTFDYIAIDTQDTYIKDSISESAYKITNGVHGEKSIYLTIPLGDPSLMMFVYFVADASAGFILPPNMSDMPCTWDNTIDLEVVCCMQSMYKKALNYVGEMNSNCKIPNGFIDFILHYQALKTSLNAGAYNEAIKWWNVLTSNTIIRPIDKPCGCYGK